ncbi:NADH-quinone oxidoreductase subunit D [Candidatus Protochlamydia phocaeensis]|uniref:NADH-quinone oxidoreductase subunit D n=1 Tax=Candidatus Protochlamydia phocaeensis TaxID=1414722 RepID=UPI0008398EB5|nr:NADH-quinone oxidoreductase subunit D [Candidatus Protochlamydia phocaeensis]
MNETYKDHNQAELAADIMELNLGPQHPSTHGVLRIKLRLDGEKLVSAEPVIGYLHTGVEKECESRTYPQVFTLVDRLDYLSGPAEEQAFAASVERLMAVEVPERAQIIRLIFLELSRISSHLLWLGTSALELNMSSVYMYCFAEREKILDLFEEVAGARMFPSIWRIGGLARDLTPEFDAHARDFLKGFPQMWKDLDKLLTNNYVWCERLQGVAIIDEELCKKYMCTGPVLRAAGVPYDIRKIYPYLGYETYQFDIPTRKEADSYARYLVRMDEMKESASLVEQALGRLKPGPVLTNNRKVALPPRRELARSMEAVIHQFKLVCEGLRPPVGEVYQCVESARGELGYYLVSDGTHRPYRVRVRSPSFAHVAVLQDVLPGHILSDVIVAIASVDPILGDVDR